MKYPKRPSKPSSRVAEPVQVYLQPPDRERLERLVTRLGSTKSDVLRRGLEALEAQTTIRPDPRDDRRTTLPTYPGGTLAHGVDLDDAAALLELMDEEDSAAAG
jgi:hypothetical protein